MKEFRIDMDWIIDSGVDYDELIAALVASGIADAQEQLEDNGFLIFEAEDANNDSIPDFLADLISDPLSTRPSKGGAWG